MASGVVNGDAGKAGLDAVDAEGVEMAGDFEFLLRGEHNAYGLFAVAESGVVKADGGFGE